MAFVSEIVAINEQIEQDNSNRSALEQQAKILTGVEAEMSVGIQHEFAAFILLQSERFGTAFSFRAGNPPMYDVLRAPKSGAILSKSSNHGLGKSLIPAHRIFTRLDEYHLPIGFHEKDEKNLIGDQNENIKRRREGKGELSLSEMQQPTVQLHYSLRNILSMVKKFPQGDLKIAGYDKDSGELRLKYQQNCGPSGFNGEYVINIRDVISKRTEGAITRPWNQDNRSAQEVLDDLAKDRKNAQDSPIDLSDFLPFVDDEFPITFREAPNEELKPFKVFSDKAGNPLVGDWDLLAVGHPKDIPVYAAEVYNTFSAVTDDREKLRLSSELLFVALKKRALERLEDMRHKHLPQKLYGRTSGIVSDSLSVASREEAFSEISTKILDQNLREQREGLDKEIASKPWLKNITEYFKIRKEFELLKNKVELKNKAKKNKSEIKNKAEFPAEQARLQQLEQFFSRHELKDFERLAFANLDPVDRYLLAINKFDDLYDEQILKNAGCISPFEFVQSCLLNTAYADEASHYGSQKALGYLNVAFDPNIKNLIQHGPENRNPYVPSNLDGKILHFYKGMIFLTQGENQLIQFYMADDFLKNNIIDIHYGWKMEKWAKVLEKQESLGQINLLNKEANRLSMRATVQCYQDYKAIMAMEQQRSRRSWYFSLNANRTEILFRHLKAYQTIPKPMTKLLTTYLASGDNLKKFPLTKENFPSKLKDYHLPIEEWSKVISKQIELRKKDFTIPPIYPELLRSYNIYLILKKLQPDTIIDKNIQQLINEQLSYGQGASISKDLMARYQASLGEKLKSGSLTGQWLPSTEMQSKETKEETKDGIKYREEKKKREETKNTADESPSFPPHQRPTKFR